MNSKGLPSAQQQKKSRIQYLYQSWEQNDDEYLIIAVATGAKFVLQEQAVNLHTAVASSG